MPEDDRAVGWYLHPDRHNQHRYWNGEDWATQCEHIAPEDHEGSPDDV